MGAESSSSGLSTGAAIGLGIGSQVAGGLFDNTLGYAFKSAYQDSQYHKQWNQWKRMTDYVNAYNSPLAQMGRLRQAGLNPALLYSGVNNTSGATASVGGDVSVPSVNKHMGPLDYMAIQSTRQQQQAQRLQNELLEEQLKQAKIETDEKYQSHITNVYTNQNAFREAVAKGGLYFNPAFYTTWQDRHGRYHFDKTSPDYDVDTQDYFKGINGDVSPITPIQYDSSLLSDYILGKLYKDNAMQSYNTRVGAEDRINKENKRDAQNAVLDWTNVNENFDLLKKLYKQSFGQEYEYNRRTFDDMTNAAISGFKEAIAKNNLLALMHAGGYLGNESPLLRFFGRKIGHEGWDSLYSPGNYLKIKGDALWNAVSQMGVDVLGAYLSRGARKPFDAQKPFSTRKIHNHDRKTGNWSEYVEYY